MSKNFKYIANIQKNNHFAEMFIYDEIGEKNINGLQFANELRYLCNLEEINEVKVRINSVGGSVLHAFSIFSSIINANLNDQNGTDVNTYLDGVAASSAGFILLAGKNIYPKDYGRLMVHGVSPVDEDGEIITDNLSENDITALDNFKNMIIDVIDKRSKLKKSVISNLLTNGKDNWFDVSQAVELGFFLSKNIQNTGLEIELPENLYRNALAVHNKAQKFIDININKNTLKMKKVINALKLQEGANEETVLNAVNKALQTATDAKSKLVAAENKAKKDKETIEELKGKVEATNKAAALSVVENAIKEGKFAPKNEDAKSTLVGQAEANLEGFKNLISQMPTKSKNILYDGGSGDGKGTKSLIEKIANRGFRTLEKEDGGLLAEIKNNDLPTFVNLYNKEYGTKKVAEDFA